jgi:putative effector of murein hydrolase
MNLFCGMIIIIGFGIIGMILDTKYHIKSPPIYFFLGTTAVSLAYPVILL